MKKSTAHLVDYLRSLVEDYSTNIFINSSILMAAKEIEYLDSEVCNANLAAENAAKDNLRIEDELMRIYQAIDDHKQGKLSDEGLYKARNKVLLSM